MHCRQKCKAGLLLQASLAASFSNWCVCYVPVSIGMSVEGRGRLSEPLLPPLLYGFWNVTQKVKLAWEVFLLLTEPHCWSGSFLGTKHVSTNHQLLPY